MEILWAYSLIVFILTTKVNCDFSVDSRTTSVDFSRGVEGSVPGTICVERMKYVDKTETNQEKECWVQNVTQCHFTYVTEYTDGNVEKCQDFYWKTCKIVFKERVYNHTSKLCKRPMIKNCDDSNLIPDNKPEPEIICQTFEETECNTTDVIPSPGDEPVSVTFCDKIPRKICAPDNCRIVQGPEECLETVSESTIEQPEELCNLQPQKHCRPVTVSVPSLRPERKCREVEKEICHTRLVDGNEIKEPVFVKYCTKRENEAVYLPPPPAISGYQLPDYNPPPPIPFNTQRIKRFHPEPVNRRNGQTPWKPVKKSQPGFLDRLKNIVRKV